MSSETQILDKLAVDLLHIKTANLYANTLKRAVEGYEPLNVNNDFDLAYFYMGNRKPVKLTSDNKPAAWEGELWINIHLKARSTSLSRAIESWIEDFRKWLYQSPDVTANKYYTLDTSLPQIVSWNSKELQDVLGDPLWSDNIAELTFKIKIIYST